MKCTIPADMLRYTATALTELAIRKRMEAVKFSGFDGEGDQIAAESLQQAAEVQKASDFYFELYKQRT